jgi:predicted HTH transcriptional regulator
MARTTPTSDVVSQVRALRAERAVLERTCHEATARIATIDETLDAIATILTGEDDATASTPRRAKRRTARRQASREKPPAPEAAAPEARSARPTQASRDSVTDRIVTALQTSASPMTPGSLKTSLGVSEPTLYKHLKTMTASGQLRRSGGRSGRGVTYALA